MARTRTEAKKTAILSAAQRAFATRDFHEVLTDDIAADAGIGKATLYRYFETKEDLYFAALVGAFGELDRTLDRLLTHEVSIEGRLNVVAREVLRVFWNRRAFYTLRHPDAREFNQQDRTLHLRREAVVRVVENILRAGTPGPTLEDPRGAAELFMGMVRATLFYRREAGSPSELAKQIVSVFVHGFSGMTATR